MDFNEIFNIINYYFFIFLSFRILNHRKKKEESKNEKIIDLEKDPKTDEYKPKE